MEVKYKKNSTSPLRKTAAHIYQRENSYMLLDEEASMMKLHVQPVSCQDSIKGLGEGASPLTYRRITA